MYMNMHNNDYYSLTYFGIINEKWYDYSTVVTLLITYRTHYTIIYLSFCCHNNIIYKNTLTYVCLVRTGQQTYILFFLVLLPPTNANCGPSYCQEFSHHIRMENP